MPADLLTIRTFSAERTILVIARGEIDLATCGLLLEHVEPLLFPEVQVTVDLTGVTFLDAAGLGQLLHLRRQVVRAGGRFILRPSPAVTALLRASHQESSFEVRGPAETGDQRLATGDQRLAT